jgi:hypothetical protein
MRVRLVRPALVAAACCALVFCASGEKEGSPGHAVQQFYEHLNAGSYDAAKRLYGAEALAVIDDPNLSSAEGFHEFALAETKQRTVSKVIVLDSQTGEDEAEVEYEVRYKDGSWKRGTVRLTREGGAWKLGLVG